MPEPQNPEPQAVPRMNDRVKELERTVHALLLGMLAVSREMENEWGVQPMPKGNYYGVNFD